MVTGPTSASFKQQQAEAGCDKAVWPDIPLDCYPEPLTVRPSPRFTIMASGVGILPRKAV